MKAWLNWGGFILGAVGVYYVARRLMQYSGQVNFTGLTACSWMILAGLMVVYGMANLLLALAWRKLMRHFRQAIDRGWAIRTYGISQIAKYIPGNIFQFAGRQAIGQAAGIAASPLAKTIFWELGLISFTGALFAVLVIPVFLAGISPYLPAALFLLLLGLAIAGSTIFLGRHIASAMKIHALFLALTGIVFYGVLYLVAGHDADLGSYFPVIIGVYVVAWLAGLLTPGAPAGLGVREVVFLALLRGVVKEDEILRAIILGRVVTIGGDVLFYILSLGMKIFIPDSRVTEPL